MLAQRRYEAVRPAARRLRKRRRTNLLRALIRNRMACVLMLALAVSFILSVYVSAYARAMETGYHRTELLSRLKVLRQENESLRLKLEALRQPDNIAEFAIANAMEPSTDIAYLTPTTQPHVARNF